MIDYHAFGKIVYDIRKRNKLSRNEVYDKTGVALETQRNIEHAKRIPSLASMETLSHFYKTDLIFLLSRCRTEIDFFSNGMIKRSNSAYNSGNLDALHKEINTIIKEFKNQEHGDKRTTKIFDQYISIYNNMNKQNYKFDSMELDHLMILLNSLSINDKGFMDNQEFFDIEIVFANMLSIRYRMNNRFDESKTIILNVIDKLNNLQEKSIFQQDLTGAAYLNYATLLHRIDHHREVIDLIDRIHTNTDHRFSHELGKLLLARKIIACHLLNPHDPMIPHLISGLLIDETPDWVIKHRDILHGKYGINHPLFS